MQRLSHKQSEIEHKERRMNTREHCCLMAAPLRWCCSHHRMPPCFRWLRVIQLTDRAATTCEWSALPWQ